MFSFCVFCPCIINSVEEIFQNKCERYSKYNVIKTFLRRNFFCRIASLNFTWDVFAIDFPNIFDIVQTDRFQPWAANRVQFRALDVSQNPEILFCLKACCHTLYRHAFKPQIRFPKNIENHLKHFWNKAISNFVISTFVILS